MLSRLISAVCMISIHALVKRATERATQVGSAYAISIHALVKRATVSLLTYSTSVIFQSTPS